MKTWREIEEDVEVGSTGGKKRGPNKRRWTVILDLGSFTRRGLMVAHVFPVGTCGVGAQKEQRVQDQKGEGRRQRDNRPVCNGKVIGPQTPLHHGRFQLPKPTVYTVGLGSNGSNVPLCIVQRSNGEFKLEKFPEYNGLKLYCIVLIGTAWKGDLHPAVE